MSPRTKEPRRILAPNPSALTGAGTNSFLIGRNDVAVIDPGPDDDAHLGAIVAAAKEGGGRITHILVTHAHRDHSAGAARLAAMTGAQVMAFGDAVSGRSAVMERLAATGMVAGGEGLDLGFRPDILLRDEETVETEEWQIRALHLPGHCGGHLCFLVDDTLFCGDIVMAWSSTLISPPDGDLIDYFRSLERISALAPARLLPAHGDPVTAPIDRIAELVAHRQARTAQILAALRERPGNAQALARRIYDVSPGLLPAATRNVLSHLLALTTLGAVKTHGEIAAETTFEAL